MTVESQPQRGARFAIYLPLTDGSRRAADDISAQPARGKELVLVCEDDAAVRAVSVQVLRAYGYKVLEAEHGVRALELLRAQTEPVDLVVTDVVMPGMSGNELARRIARRHPTVRVLFVSGYLPGGSEEEQALESSPGLLRKPFTANQLLRRVRRCLDVPMGSISRPKHRRRSRASDKSDKAGRGPDPMV